MALNEGTQILKLDPDELEELIKKWLAIEREEYFDFSRNSGSYDRGLDAVGFLTPSRHDGDWDNFQCKQLKKALGEGEFFQEIGKVFHYASKGEFTPPRRYIFVAPAGASAATRAYAHSPSKLKNELLNKWDERCATKIVAKQSIPLSIELGNLIKAYDFSKIEIWDVRKLVEIPNVRKILHYHIDVNPGKAPSGTVPAAVSANERPYIGQLIGVYGDDCSMSFVAEQDVQAHEIYGQHLTNQRRRYYDAEAFHRHFRDNIDSETLRQFDQDILDGVIDRYLSSSGLSRVNSVMEVAASLQVSGIFGKHCSAPNSVKQGVCHLHANTGHLPWKK